MRSALPLLLLALALPVAAQPAGHACAGVANPAERLACYDRAFPPSPEVIEAASEQAQAEFGLDKPKDALRNPGQTPGQVDPDRIDSRVTGVSRGGDGQRVFTLENGQVWIQTDVRGSGHVQAGDTVQVRKAILGGYQLVMQNGVSVRVRRTR
jgi:hypothetical protein